MQAPIASMLANGLGSNSSFKPTSLRGVGPVLALRSHGSATTSFGGLTQALGIGSNTFVTLKSIDLRQDNIKSKAALRGKNGKSNSGI